MMLNEQGKDHHSYNVSHQKSSVVALQSLLEGRGSPTGASFAVQLGGARLALWLHQSLLSLS